MKELYQQLDDILKFFTTEATIGLPQQIGKFTCIPLMSEEDEHAGYLVTNGKEMNFFPASSISSIAGKANVVTHELETLFEQQWEAKTGICLN